MSDGVRNEINIKVLVLFIIHMYKKLNISDKHLIVLTLFTSGPATQLFVREVARKAAIAPRTAQLILDSLESRGVLRSEVKGKIRLFSLKENLAQKTYLAMAEEYKRLQLIKDPLIYAVVEEMLSHTTGVVLVFGSYAKGLQRKDSDLDVMVVGEYDDDAVRKISRTYQLDVSIKKVSGNPFEAPLKDPLFLEILANHVVLSGTDEFVKMLG